LLISKHCAIVGHMEDTGNMAVAAYFQVLRNNRRAPNGQRMTQAMLAKEVGKHLDRKVAQSVISKAETGRGAVMGDVMAAMLAALGGRLEDVLTLFKKSSPEDGKALALARIKEFTDQIPREQVPNAIRIIEELESDPSARARLRQLLRDAESDSA
jgi:hypothetical protein